MNRAVTVLLVALCVGPGSAFAQGADDWEFAADPARQLTVAAARYENGPSIIVRCEAGALTTLLIGMPVSSEKIELDATRFDGRTDVQVWRPVGSDGVFRGSLAGRAARFMRGGGSYSVRTREGVAPAFAVTFDLPSQPANLDRVLAACGWALTDDRDLLPRALGVTLVNPNARQLRERRGRSRSVSGRSRPAEPPMPPPTPAERPVSCIVRDLKLAECRPVHATIGGTPDPEAVVRWLSGRPLYGVDAAAVEGSVFYNDNPEPLIVVERIEIL